MSTFIFFRKPGPGWVEGSGTRQQPDWEEHARYMDDLFERGKVVLSGPYDDYSRVLLIVNCSSEDEARHLFDDDIWTATGVLEPDGLHAWTAFLYPRDWPAD